MKDRRRSSAAWGSRVAATLVLLTEGVRAVEITCDGNIFNVAGSTGDESADDSAVIKGLNDKLPSTISKIEWSPAVKRLNVEGTSTSDQNCMF